MGNPSSKNILNLGLADTLRGNSLFLTREIIQAALKIAEQMEPLDPARGLLLSFIQGKEALLSDLSLLQKGAKDKTSHPSKGLKKQDGDLLIALNHLSGYLNNPLEREQKSPLRLIRSLNGVLEMNVLMANPGFDHPFLVSVAMAMEGWKEGENSLGEICPFIQKGAAIVASTIANQTEEQKKMLSSLVVLAVLYALYSATQWMLQAREEPVKHHKFAAMLSSAMVAGSDALAAFAKYLVFSMGADKKEARVFAEALSVFVLSLTLLVADRKTEEMPAVEALFKIFLSFLKKGWNVLSEAFDDPFLKKGALTLEKEDSKLFIGILKEAIFSSLNGPDELTKSIDALYAIVKGFRLSVFNPIAEEVKNAASVMSVRG